MPKYTPVEMPSTVLYPQREEKVMTPETFRFLALEISSLLSTIIAVIAVDQNNQ